MTLGYPSLDLGELDLVEVPKCKPFDLIASSQHVGPIWLRRRLRKDAPVRDSSLEFTLCPIFGLG